MSDTRQIKTIKVQAGQTMLDIAVQEYGTVEGIILVMQANPGLSVTSTLTPGQELIIWSNMTVDLVRETVKVEPYASQLQNLLMQWAQLINANGNNNTPVEGHSRLHPMISALDHSAATAGDRNKYLHTNKITGAIEFIEGPTVALPTDFGIFKGTCDLSTSPGIPIADEWWSATETGTYFNFGGVVVSTLAGTFNYIKWTQATTSWSLETVAINMNAAIIPRVVDGLLDFFVDGNLQIGAKPYATKKVTDPGFAYLYSDADAIPSFYTNNLFLDGNFHACTLYSRGTSGAGSSSMAILDSYTLLLDVYDSYYRRLRSRIELDQGLNKLLIQCSNTPDGEYEKCAPIRIGSPPVRPCTYFHGEYIEIDDFNQRFDINFTKIRHNKLSEGILYLNGFKEEGVYDPQGAATYIGSSRQLMEWYEDATAEGDAGQTSLYAFEIPANTICNLGQKLVIEFTGVADAEDTFKYLEVFFAGNSLGSYLFTSAGSTWTKKITIIRSNTSNVRVTDIGTINNLSGAMYSEFSGIDFVNPIAIELFGNAFGLRSYITAKMGYIEWKPNNGT